jgi:hypothetical protein
MWPVIEDGWRRREDQISAREGKDTISNNGEGWAEARFIRGQVEATPTSSRLCKVEGISLGDFRWVE